MDKKQSCLLMALVFSLIASETKAYREPNTFFLRSHCTSHTTIYDWMQVTFDVSQARQGKRYLVTKDAEPFHVLQAEQSCNVFDGYLFEPNDAEEFDYVADFVRKVGGNETIHFFTGINDIETEGEYRFKFSGKSLPDLLRRGQNQPDNARDNEDCIAISSEFNYKLSDQICDERKAKYICEITDAAYKWSLFRSFKFSGEYQDHIYVVSGHKESFDLVKAEALCERLGGYLFEPDTQEEYDTVAASLKKDGVVDHVFTGIYDIPEEGVYRFYKSKKLFPSIGRWGDDQPNNWQESQHCVEMRKEFDYFLNDQVCNHVNSLFICEIPTALESLGHDFLKAVKETTCPIAWFGPDCQYKCRYEPESDVETCYEGWFGPECQYMSVDYEIPGGQEWPNDDNISTCNPSNQTSFTFVLKDGLYFTWARLVFGNNESVGDIQVNVMRSDGETVIIDKICPDVNVVKVTSTIVDIYCPDSPLYPSYEVFITGERLSELCELHISGGRNVALKQPTQQETTYLSWTSDLAVDSRYKYRPQSSITSCSHTEDEEGKWWALQFRKPVSVNRFRIFNRIGDLDHVCCPRRLMGFSLEAEDETGNNTFSFVDSNPLPMPVYDILPQSRIVEPVQSIRITKVDESISLTLCEVEVFGDSVCPPDKYGRDCELTCDCGIPSNGNRACAVSTGACLSNCEPSFSGPHCTPALSQATTTTTSVVARFQPAAGSFAGVVAAVVGGLVVVVSIIILMRRRYLYKRSPEELDGEHNMAQGFAVQDHSNF